MNLSIETRQIGEWWVNQHLPDGDGPHPVLLLVHGWTGDENVMWIFAQRLSREYLMIAPRGLHPAPNGGYGWHEHRQEDLPHYEELQPSIDRLLDLLRTDNFPAADFSRLAAIGFSQGAALLFTAALLYPDRFQVLAGLSGFLPSGVDPLVESKPLTGKPIFIAHGRLDDIVPVARSRQAVELLERAGAKVSYCEEDVGHKLSSSCFRSMESFLEIQEL